MTVNVGEEREAIAGYLARHGLDLPVLRDPSGRTWRSLGGVGLPANATETPAGRSIQVGPRGAAAWAETLAKLGCPALSP